MFRKAFFVGSAALIASIVVVSYWFPSALWMLVVVLPVAAVGVHDARQTSHSILRNFPVLGRARYLLEEIRPEIQQYFIESTLDAFPIQRELRSLVYQRAKGATESHPFGTHHDVYGVGYEWAGHAMAGGDPIDKKTRVEIGGPQCSLPYASSFLNVSAMSFGALSPNAILALNKGAKTGGFAHNTGEGGISPYHIQHGGDLIWQIGTGYFGCRKRNGRFDEGLFAKNATRDQVRMIEIKLSQGAKPGHGGVLPGEKVTPEIAAIRNVAVGKTVLSPPRHSAFSSPIELLEFVSRLRELSGGKPVGFKLCVGRPSEIFALCKAIVETGISPDFISVDGGEGGTGAAPLEFSNSIGMPARDGWAFVHGALTAAGVRDDVRILASGKILTGFHMVRALALGADACYSARGMMLALGCIQALRCNSDTCPTGVATQNPALFHGLVPEDKAARVARFHRGTLHSFFEILDAMGVSSPDAVTPDLVFRRIEDMTVKSYAELYPLPAPASFTHGWPVPDAWRTAWEAASKDSFAPKSTAPVGARVPAAPKAAVKPKAARTRKPRRKKA
jgi:glutamate synthase domain-containing protein 2